MSDSNRIPSVKIDTNLTSNDHVKSVCKNSYNHIQTLHHIRPMLTEDIDKSVVCLLVNAQFDYSNSELCSVTTKKITKLQMVQKTLACVVTSLQHRDHIMPTLKRLHWLPIKSRIDFQIASLLQSPFNQSTGILHNTHLVVSFCAIAKFSRSQSPQFCVSELLQRECQCLP